MSPFTFSEGRDIQVRALTIDDYDQIVQLWRKAGLGFKPRGRDSRMAIEAQMKSDQVFFLGAFEDHRLLGAVVASWDGRKGWINRLCVDPEYRRHGIAEALVTEAEKVLRETGAQIFSALIIDSNTASKNLFKKCGYTELGDIKYFSKRDSQDA